MDRRFKYASAQSTAMRSVARRFGCGQRKRMGISVIERHRTALINVDINRDVANQSSGCAAGNTATKPVRTPRKPGSTFNCTSRCSAARCPIESPSPRSQDDWRRHDRNVRTRACVPRLDAGSAKRSTREVEHSVRGASALNERSRSRGSERASGRSLTFNAIAYARRLQ